MLEEMNSIECPCFGNRIVEESYYVNVSILGNRDTKVIIFLNTCAVSCVRTHSRSLHPYVHRNGAMNNKFRRAAEIFSLLFFSILPFLHLKETSDTTLNCGLSQTASFTFAVVSIVKVGDKYSKLLSKIKT